MLTIDFFTFFFFNFPNFNNCWYDNNLLVWYSATHHKRETMSNELKLGGYTKCRPLTQNTEFQPDCMCFLELRAVESQRVQNGISKLNWFFNNFFQPYCSFLDQKHTYMPFYQIRWQNREKKEKTTFNFCQNCHIWSYFLFCA